MGATVYQITNPAIVYSAIYLGADQRKLQSPVLSTLVACWQFEL